MYMCYHIQEIQSSYVINCMCVATYPIWLSMNDMQF